MVETFILSIPRRMPKTPVASIAHASAAYSQMRDMAGEGASTFPSGKLMVGKTAYRISYNGRVWDNAGTCVYPA
jgi:hypothetical protein